VEIGKLVLCNSIIGLGEILNLINDVDALSIFIDVFGGIVSAPKTSSQ
jgi:hypothetical protein